MSLEEIMARAREAAENKKQETEKQGVEEEIKTYEQTQEQLAAKQGRLEEIAKQKGMDEKKLAEIRQFLGTSSGFAKGKKQIKSMMTEAGMTDEEIQPFIDEAKSEQESIVVDKLGQRGVKGVLKTRLESMSTEETQLNEEVQSLSGVELSPQAQQELDRQSAEKLKDEILDEYKKYLLPGKISFHQTNFNEGLQKELVDGKYDNFFQKLTRSPGAMKQIRDEIYQNDVTYNKAMNLKIPDPYRTSDKITLREYFDKYQNQSKE